MKLPFNALTGLLAAAAFVLAGCGNKGSLTLPPPHAKIADHTAATQR